MPSQTVVTIHFHEARGWQDAAQDKDRSLEMKLSFVQRVTGARFALARPVPPWRFVKESRAGMAVEQRQCRA